MPKRCKTGEKVVSALKKGGHTQAWLARELGVAPAVLWRWIAGECTPRVDFALEIERLTGVSASLWIPKQKGMLEVRGPRGVCPTSGTSWRRQPTRREA